MKFVFILKSGVRGGYHLRCFKNWETDFTKGIAKSHTSQDSLQQAAEDVDQGFLDRW